MSLKQEIETWMAALAAYDSNDFDAALHSFTAIGDTSKILFNMGVIHATLGEHERAVAYYQRAIALDQYLAVGYFQQGVSNFLLGDFEEALANFNDALLYLRGNRHIDYEQLGLKFKLHSCEVLFNRGLCSLYLQQRDAGMLDLTCAAREKVVPDHDVIDEAIRERAEGYTVFSIPVGVVYRPSDAKVRNLKSKDYLGRARLIAHQQYQQQYQQQVQQQQQQQMALFSAADPRRKAALAALSLDDRANERLSYGAQNLVRAGLQSRGAPAAARQQSEPPLHRNIFPPTPPPEPEQQRRISEGAGSVATSATGGGPAPLPLGQQQQQQQPQPPPRSALRPPRLELGAAAFDQRPKQQQQQQQEERPRLGTTRSASERPAARGETSSGSMGRGSQQRLSFREAADAELSRAAPLSRESHSQRLSEASAASLSVASAGSEMQQLHHRSVSSALMSMSMSISEEDGEDEGSGVSALEATEAASALGFEMVPPPLQPGLQRRRSATGVIAAAAASPSSGGPAAAGSSSRISRTRPGSRRAAQGPSATAATSVPPEMRRLRVKVHGEDVRHMMAAADVSFGALEAAVRAKLGLGPAAAIKIKARDDEGDMVVLGDQEDLDVAIAACRAVAATEGVEMGKLEVWVQVM